MTLYLGSNQVSGNGLSLDSLNTSKMYLTGEVSTDLQGYLQLQEMYHSTFDLSKFEVVGSPVISEDGIATGFLVNSSTYIKVFSDGEFDFSKPWQIDCKITPGTLPDSDKRSHWFLSALSNTSRNIVLGIEGTAKTLKVYLSSDGKSFFANGVSGSATFETGNTYYIRVLYDLTRYEVQYSTDAINYTTDIIVENNSPLYNGGLKIGNNETNTNCFRDGLIDLKWFSIKSEGVLVFNGNKNLVDSINDIEIPYTESNTGSKIVDAIYRDRIIDLYNQQGHALYYTIDTENKNITLPMGELYGMLANAGGGQAEIQDSGTVINNGEAGLDAIGVVSKSGRILHDWIGTKEEYEAGIADGSIDNEWVCWITDEEDGVALVTRIDGLAEQLDSKANDSDVLHTAGDETKSGNLTVDGDVVANKFVGNLKGTADIAYMDGTGNIISETYATKDELQNASVSIEDSETIVNNESSGLDAVGMKTKDGSILYDWIGTKEEYEAGIADGSISEDWICWVTDEEGGDKYRSMPIGSVFAVNASKDYVPDGCLPCDGAEYSKTQFKQLWDTYLTGELETVSTFMPIEGITKNGKSYVFDCTTLSNDANLVIAFNFTTGNDVNSEQILFSLDGQPIVLSGGVINYTGTFDSNEDEIFSITVSPDTTYSVEYGSGVGGFEFKIDDNRLLGFGSIDSISSLVAGSASFKGSFDLSNGFYRSAVTNYRDLPLVETVTETKMKPLLNTCTYSEYQQDLDAYGQCGKFGLETRLSPISSNTALTVTGGYTGDVSDVLTYNVATTEIGDNVTLDEGILNSNGVLSGFSCSFSSSSGEPAFNYTGLTFNVLVGQNLFLYINTTDDVTSSQGLINELGLGISEGIFGLGSVGLQIIVIDTEIATIEPNTSYIISVESNSISLRNADSLEILGSTTLDSMPDSISFGYTYNTSSVSTGSRPYFYGTLDLTKSYYKNEFWYKDEASIDPFTYGLTVTGTPDNGDIITFEEQSFFRVPLIKDGAVIQQAMTVDELGKSYNAGLPNIEGKIVSNQLSDWMPSGAFSLENSEATLAGGSSASRQRIMFDASLSSAIYGNSDTVQMNAVALRYFVVVANGTINQSQMNWSEWSSSLQGRATADLSNVTESGRTEIVSWNIPDYSKQIEITVVSNGLTTFTAPSGGYVWGKQMSSTTAKTITINGVEVFSHFTNSGTISNPFYYIVGEGDVVVVDNYTITDNNYLYFAPMKGTN